MNSPISLIIDLVMLDLSYYWIYLTEPLVGTILAVIAAYLLRGPGGDVTAAKK
jgi:aquaporin Z